MGEIDFSWGPSWDGPTGELRAAQYAAVELGVARLRAAEAEAAALRRQVAELEDEVEHLIVGLCHATLHDGRGGRVGLPMLWRSWLDPAGATTDHHPAADQPPTADAPHQEDGTPRPVAATRGPAR
jgi:hypothetical protein